MKPAPVNAGPVSQAPGTARSEMASGLASGQAGWLAGRLAPSSRPVCQHMQLQRLAAVPALLPGCLQSGSAVIRPCKDDLENLSAAGDDAMSNGCLHFSSLLPTKIGDQGVYYAYRAQLGAVPTGTGAECTTKGEACMCWSRYTAAVHGQGQRMSARTLATLSGCPPPRAGLQPSPASAWLEAPARMLVGWRCRWEAAMLASFVRGWFPVGFLAHAARPLPLCDFPCFCSWAACGARCVLLASTRPSRRWRAASWASAAASRTVLVTTGGRPTPPRTSSCLA